MNHANGTQLLRLTGLICRTPRRFDRTFVGPSVTPPETAKTTRILVAFQPSVGGWHDFRRHALLSGDSLISLSRILTFSLVGSIPQSLRAQTSGTWASTGALNTPRTAHTATLLPNGQVLVTGGEDLAHNFLTSAELYNPATGKWTVTGSTATPRVARSVLLS